MEFQIHKAINNFYTGLSLSENKLYSLKIKGKILRCEREYNPIAVGDIVKGEPYSENEGLIYSVNERKSCFMRWNRKAEMNQIIVANQDQSAIVLSRYSPPFRPRFVDRALTCSFGADILLIMNKSDYPFAEKEEERWELYKKLGFNTISVSVKTKEGIEDLKKLLENKITAFVGQSGVGKSSLINLLVGSGQRVGNVSEKYNRGRHTTNHALYLSTSSFTLIDTPGVRELIPPLENKKDILVSYPEFKNANCLYSDCLHVGEEGCKVPEMIDDGLIDKDRYFSYQRAIKALDERAPSYMKGKKDKWK